MFVREIELGEDDGAKVVQVDQKNEGDTGVVVWDAAIVLSKYLENIKDDLRGKSAIGKYKHLVSVLGYNTWIFSDKYLEPPVFFLQTFNPFLPSPLLFKVALSPLSDLIVAKSAQVIWSCRLWRI